MVPLETSDGAAEQANWDPPAVQEPFAGSSLARMASMLKAPAFMEARPATISTATMSNRSLTDGYKLIIQTFDYDLSFALHFIST